MATTLYDLTKDALERVGDQANKIWSRDEMDDYVIDGYNELCRQTSALFDIVVIENVPIVGNWQTSLEKYLAEQKPGFGLTDEPFHFTGEHERNLGPHSKGGIGGSYSGPAPATSPSDRTYFDADTYLTDIDTDIKQLVPGGQLPQSTLEVLRVAFDRDTLRGMTSAAMKDLDPQYESREGRPQWYLLDKYGMHYLRVVPVADGTAAYDTIDGSWGVFRQTDDTAVSEDFATFDQGATGGFGILRHRDDTFPSGGPWGFVRRVHPDDMNIKVEVYRLGRDLNHYPCELPQSYEKYIVYWALSEALRREGPGQNVELADHFLQRFRMGVERLTRRKRDIQPERVASLGGGRTESGQFGNLGDPTFPPLNSWSITRP